MGRQATRSKKKNKKQKLYWLQLASPAWPISRRILSLCASSRDPISPRDERRHNPCCRPGRHTATPTTPTPLPPLSSIPPHYRRGRRLLPRGRQPRPRSPHLCTPRRARSVHWHGRLPSVGAHLVLARRARVGFTLVYLFRLVCGGASGARGRRLSLRL
jgi:hypothetical protein